MRQVLTKIIATVLSALTVIGLVVHALFFQVQIQQVPSIQYLTNVPSQVQAMFAGQNMSMFGVISINDRKIQYAYYGGYSSMLSGVEPLLKVLKENQGSLRNRMPNGIYVFSVIDGLHHPYFNWPVLTFASTKTLVQHGLAVLMPDAQALKGYQQLFSHMQLGMHKYPWSSKTAKIFWRGQANGGTQSSNDFNSFPRLSFLHNTRDLSYVDAGFAAYANNLNPNFAQRVEHEFPLKSPVARNESLAYKYLIDIDGESCSYERMAWIMYSNSLLMKHKSDKIQWYYDNLRPGIHYLPIAEDFHDLPQAFAWAEMHPKQTQRIIANAHNLALEVFGTHAIHRATAQAFRNYQQIVAMRNPKRPISVDVSF